MRPLYSIATNFLALLSSVAFAQEITVTATRIPKLPDEIPAAVSVVSGEEVQLARQQLGLDESLAQVPGVFMQDRYNFAQDLRVSIRGFGARANFGIRGVRIFVDGIPQTLPDGQGAADSIDLGSVGRVTVLRGASSSLYGNAAGGVILVESEPPGEMASADARLSFGESGFSKQQLKVSGTEGSLGYLANAADLEYHGFRAHESVRRRSFNGKLSYAIDEHSDLKLSLAYTDVPQALDPGGLTAALKAANPRQAAPGNLLFDAGESFRQTQVGLTYDKDFGEGQSITARNYYVWRTFDNTLPFKISGAVSFDRFFFGGGLQYTDRGTLAGRNNRLIAGVDLDSQDDDRKRFDNNFGVFGALGLDEDEIVDTAGVFIQDELDLNDRLTLTAGARHDSVRFKVDDHFLADGNNSGARTLTQTSPTGALLYRLTPALNLYANVATSFETPTTAELANPNGGGFNPNLNPQTAVNYEIGAKGTAGARNHYTLALFTIDVKDELIPYELPASPGRSFYRNAGKSRRKGFELGLESSPAERLNLAIDYTYSDFYFRQFSDDAGNDFADKRLPGIPSNVLHAQASYHYPFGLFVACDALYVDRLFVDNANTVSDGAYTLANLRLGYTRHDGRRHWSVFGGVNNLFDESYDANTRINAAGGRYFEPGPGRTVYTGVELKWDY